MIETEKTFLKALVDFLPDVIFVIDTTGVLQYQNPRAEKVLLVEAGSMGGRSLVEYIHPDDMGAFRHLLALTGRWKESPISNVFRFRRGDGSWIALETYAVTLLDHPAVHGILLVSRPLSRTKTSQPHSGSDRLRAIVDATYHAIIAIDEGSTIQYANSAVERLFGYPVSALVGKSLEILIPERFRDLHNRGLKHYVETGVKHANWTAREVQALHKNGREIPVQVSYQEFQESGKRFFVGILEDISARKKAEQRLLTQYAVTRVLAGSRNLNETIPHMLRALGTGLGFEYVELWLGQNGMLECAGDWHVPHLDPGKFRSPVGTKVELSVSHGILGKVWQSGRTVWVSDLSRELLIARAQWVKELDLAIGLFTPVRFQEKRVGVLALFATAALERDPELTEFLEVLGGQIGDLLERKKGEEERARLLARERAARAAAQESEQRLSFQADASLILSSSLDYFGSLSQIARLIVPRIADWCAVDILDEHGTLQRVTLVHRDPAKAQLARELRLKFSPSPQLRLGIGNVMRTGQSELYPEITDDLLRRFAADQEHLQALKQFGFRSAMIVPLRVRGQPLGVITFVNAESGRTFDRLDLTFAEDLARRAAIAIDNARLYTQAQESVNQLKAKASEIERLNMELERRVAERTAQLEAANKELEAFTYSVSHDLRAPVRAVHGFTDILVQDHAKNLDAEGQRLLAILRQSAEKMGQLIDDLLRFSRAGRQSMEFTTIDMTRLAHEVFEELNKHESGRRVHCEVHPLPPTYADLSMIRQVFVNLLSNALKFSPRNGTAIITVTGEQHESFNSYAVRDNGVGFNMNFAHKLFGVFQRLHSEEEYPGTGVGLALCQRIIHRHGGTISAFSIPNQQTTFSFTLPKGPHVQEA